MSQPFLNIRALRDERFNRERALFISRHRRMMAKRGFTGWCYGFMGGCGFTVLLFSIVRWLTQ